MPDGSKGQLIATERFFRRIPPDVAASFTRQQVQAISRAVYRAGRAPPVNIRITIPVIFGRFYLAIIAGRERRGRQRLREERAANPLSTLGNFIFVVIAAILFYVLAATGMALYATGSIEALASSGPSSTWIELTGWLARQAGHLADLAERL